jgi:CHASE2 domain-containing sensor protein
MVLSFYTLRQVALPFALIAISIILRGLALVSLILFLSGVTMSPLPGLGGHSKTASRRLL